MGCALATDAVSFCGSVVAEANHKVCGSVIFLERTGVTTRQVRLRVMNTLVTERVMGSGGRSYAVNLYCL